MEQENMKVIVTVVNSGFGNQVVEVARENGARGATIFSARGTGLHNNTILGIKVEPEKEIVLSVISETICTTITDAIFAKCGTSTPASGVCFCLPVSHFTQITEEPVKEEVKAEDPVLEEKQTEIAINASSGDENK